LILDDPDAPGGTWVHWLLYDISARTHNLAQGRPDGLGVSGPNSWGEPGYRGPCPPKGHGPHRYFFRLHAMDVRSVGLPAGSSRSDLERAMKGHILAEAHYMGRYEQK
jgi:Raf kinase inhibitor-like YbhB/YbcL family protein